MARLASLMLALLVVACATVGRDFSFEDAQRIQLGMTEVQVLEIMGKPTNKSLDGTGELWMWMYVTSTIGSPPNSKSFAVKIKSGQVIYIQQ
jgi:outer membrane protein assembly factor BamE (lipoprotein component of BamABCDE complex)